MHDTHIYPMMSEQEMMWLDDLVTNGPSRYLESWVCRLTGQVNQAAIHYAFRQIVSRHEVMRTRFRLIGDLPAQEVMPAGREEQPSVRSCQPAEVETILGELVSRPMDLERGAARVTVLQVPPRDTIVVAQLHHILIDDWALHLLEQEFAEHYNAYVAMRSPRVNPVSLQPGPYAVAQREAPRDAAAHGYWRDKLLDLPAVRWPHDGGVPHTGEPSGRAERISFRIGTRLHDQIRLMCKKLRVTPFTLFATASMLLLYAESEDPDVIIGCPFSHRGPAELDLMIAPLTGLLPLRVRIQPGEPVTRLITDVQRTLREAMVHRNIQYEDIARMTRPPRRAARTPLCPLVLVADDAADSGVEIPGVAARRLFVPPGMSKFYLYFHLQVDGDSYSAYLDYSTDMFAEPVARRFTGDFVALLDLVTSCPDNPVTMLTGALPGTPDRAFE
jgi:hypothetical protein